MQADSLTLHQAADPARISFWDSENRALADSIMASIPFLPHVVAISSNKSAPAKNKVEIQIKLNVTVGQWHITAQQSKEQSR